MWVPFLLYNKAIDFEEVKLWLITIKFPKIPIVQMDRQTMLPRLTKEKVLLENPENNRERMDYYRSINRKFVIFDLLYRVWISIR